MKKPNTSLAHLKDIIGCGMLELVQIAPDIVLLCDEEGRLKPNTVAFRFYGCPDLVIAGNAIVMGDNGNRFLPLHEDIANLRKIVEWVAPQDVPEPRL